MDILFACVVVLILIILVLALWYFLDNGVSEDSSDIVQGYNVEDAIKRLRAMSVAD